MSYPYTIKTAAAAIETICALKERADRLEHRGAEILATSETDPVTRRNQATALAERARICRDTAAEIQAL